MTEQKLPPQTYLYTRTSTIQQNVEQQTDVLKGKYKWDAVFEEQLSGKTTDRPIFNKLKSVLKSGDTVIVLSVSRLGRNTIEVLQFVEAMTKEGVHIVIDDLGIDITSTGGKLVLTTLAAVAEMQRDEMLDKQRIGIDRAKAEGKYKGKQVSDVTIKKCESALVDISNGLSKEKAAKANSVGIATLYRYIKQKTA